MQRKILLYFELIQEDFHNGKPYTKKAFRLTNFKEVCNEITPISREIFERITKLNVNTNASGNNYDLNFKLIPGTIVPISAFLEEVGVLKVLPTRSLSEGVIMLRLEPQTQSPLFMQSQTP